MLPVAPDRSADDLADGLTAIATRLERAAARLERAGPPDRSGTVGPPS
ncbi:hypothetical protein TOK_4343 [Pseudonocardia sp. N23]|nr:hypothetical protein TOK_4343 [Pseudonocardia sp. N23]